jgi:cytochrome c
LVEFCNDKFIPLPKPINIVVSSAEIDVDINNGNTWEYWYSNASAERGKEIFKKCTSCHSLENINAPLGNQIGPHIIGIVDQKISYNANYNYSAAIKKRSTSGDAGKNENIWTSENLNKFLSSPQKFAPGNKMTFIGLSEPQDRADVIAFLKR